LWVSQGIVQKHQGSLRLRSRQDGARHGTCCTVFLPFVTAGAAPGEEDRLAPSSDEAPDELIKSAGSGDDRSAA